MEKVKHGEPFISLSGSVILLKSESEAHRKLEAIMHSFYQYNETDIQEFRTTHLSELSFVEYKQRKLKAPIMVGRRNLRLCIICRIRILFRMLSMF